MKGRLGKLDFAILTVTILLTLFGLVMVFSASYYEAQQNKGGSTFYLTKQLLGAGVGVVVMLVASVMAYRVYNRPIVPYFLVLLSVVLLIVVLFADRKNNVNRFLNIGGFSFQPSELGRLAVVFFIAWWTPKHSEQMRSDKLKVVFTEGLGMPLLVAGGISGLILAGKNLSMAGSTLLVALVMMLVAGVRLKPLLIMLGVTIVFGVVFTLIEAYRMTRLIVFMNPWNYVGGNTNDEGYQLVQSLYALGNGGIFGVGLGNSRQKLLYLPYMYSDFILSIIGEELGFLGMCALVLAFWVLLWRGMLVAAKALDEYGMMLAAGITALIGIQFLINLLVVTSTMPPTGVPLPFISAGNTSLIVFMAAVGVLLNVSRSSVKT